MSECRRVLVTGGTGFLGRAILRRLADRPDPISMILRHPPAIDPPVGGGIHQADLAEIEAGHPAFASVNTVIHTAVDYRSASRSVEMVRRVVAACRHHGVERIVYISSQNAGFQRPGRYSRGKIDGERLIRESGLAWVTLRPTLLYGSKGGPFLSSLIRFARTTRIIPVLGSGDALIQPVHRRDVAAIVVTGLGGLDGQIITIGGADAISLGDLALAIRGSVGRSLIIPLPLTMLRIPSAFNSQLREKLDEIEENRTLSEMETGRLRTLLDRAPRSMPTDLPAIIASHG